MITLNGVPRALDAPTTVATLVGSERRGIAVARNGEVVPRSEWERTHVVDGDRIEILEAAPGG